MSEKKEPEIQDENAIIMERRSKLQEIRARGVAFPNHFRPADYSQDLHDLYDNEIKEDLEKKGVIASIAGRMMLKRVMGKASFATIQDKQGKIQLYVARDLINSETNPELYSHFKKWDLGDILGAKGRVFKTNTNVGEHEDLKFGLDTHMSKNEITNLKNLLIIPFQKNRQH